MYIYIYIYTFGLYFCCRSSKFIYYTLSSLLEYKFSQQVSYEAVETRFKNFANALKVVEIKKKAGECFICSDSFTTMLPKCRHVIYNSYKKSIFKFHG